MMHKTQGGVTIKKINGKDYYYHQWYEDGRKRSQIISEDDYYRIKQFIDSEKKVILSRTEFKGIKMLTGQDLLKEICTVVLWERRDCFKDLLAFLNSPLDGKVLILYGLRRTGKTTMMFQSILEKADEADKIAYLKIDRDAKSDDLYILLKQLSLKGFKYVFIDEVTLLEDFASSSSYLSDIFGFQMKVVLSGTDSLCFTFAKADELFGRAHTIHTSYISFKEFSRLLNIHEIDKYIEYGGTLQVEGINYHSFSTTPTFYDAKSTISYIDSSISKNIQHALTNYKDGYNFERLKCLKERNDLTNVINRIVQDDTHRFLKSVINRVFKSSDYGSLINLMKKKSNFPALEYFINKIDEEKIYNGLMDRLEIKNGVEIDEYSLRDLHEYFRQLDLIEDIEVIDIETGQRRKETVFSQPGLRFSLAKELTQSLLNSQEVSDIPYIVSSFLYESILSNAKGKILEDIVLSNEIHKHDESKAVFKCSFIVGEYDMAIFDKNKLSISLFEIKHSDKKSPEQTRHLIDTNKLELVKKQFGSIQEKSVLYRGANGKNKDIQYVNIEEYLCK